MPVSMRRHCFAAFLAAAVSFPAASMAQEFPARPIRMLLTNPPGGPTDTSARLFADKLRSQLGQTVLVENRAGANGRIAVELFLRSEADGYTLMYSGAELMLLPTTSKGFTIDYARDISPVSHLLQGTLAFLVKPEATYKSIDELVAYMKANPGKVNYANISGPDLFVSEMFKSATGTRYETVRYNGGAPAFQAVMTGQADWLVTATGAAKGLHESGKLRMIATNGDKRNSYLPQIPAVGESSMAELRELSKFSGFSGFSFGIVAPGKPQASILGKLHGAVRNAAQDAEFVKKMGDQGYVVVASSPEDYYRNITTESATWARIAKQIGYESQ